MRLNVVSLARRACAVAALSLLAVPVLAQGQGQGGAGSTLAKLSTTRSITLGVRQDAAPFSYVDAMGKPGGFAWALCQAIVQQLSADLKVPLTVRFQPVSLVDSFQQIKNGRIDLHCGITANTVQRAKEVAFSNTYFVSRVAAAYRAKDGKYSSPREFGRTGVLQGSTAQQLMQDYTRKKISTYGLGPLTVVGSYTEGVKLLKSGGIDTLVADALMVPADADIAIRREPLTLEPYALTMRKGDDAFVEAVDRAMQRVLGSPLGKQLAEQAGVKIDPMTQDAWRSPNKHPAPPLM